MLGSVGIIDPSRSAVTILLKRDDVRSELFISSKQREQIEELLQTADSGMVAASRAPYQNIDRQALRNMTQEERQAKQQEIQQQSQTAVETYQSDLDKKVAAILNPKQIARLHELDLQWRSVLAVVDPKVAKDVDLTPEETAKVQPIYQEYQTESFKVVQKTFGNLRGQNTGQPMTQAQMQAEMQKRLDTAKPALDKVRSTESDKALAVLTPEQQKKWKSMVGVKFTFRIYVQ